jgi:hypothetical protein
LKKTHKEEFLKGAMTFSQTTQRRMTLKRGLTHIL